MGLHAGEVRPLADEAFGQRRSRAATLLAIGIFVPLWMSRPLGAGDASLAFAVPFVLAGWALMQRAAPSAFGSILVRGGPQGLWLETVAVATVIVMAILSTLVSPEPFRAFRVLLPMSYAICALVIVSRVPPLARRRLVYAVTVAGIVVLGASLVLAQLPGGRAWVMRDYRLRAFVENANQLGLLILAIWPIALALLLNSRSIRMRLFCLLGVAVLATALLLSGTKTALALAFVATALLWLYHASRSGTVGKTVVTITLALCVLVLAVPVLLYVLSIASPITFNKVNAILTHGVWEYRSIQTRDELWQESLRLGLAHPLLGAGAGTRVFGVSHSHNFALDYFRGMGVLGLAAALTLTGLVVARALRFLVGSWSGGSTNRPSDVMTAAMYLGAAGYIIGNYLSDSLSPTTAFPFWLMYFCAVLATRSASSQMRPPIVSPLRKWKAPSRPDIVGAGAV